MGKDELLDAEDNKEVTLLTRRMQTLLKNLVIPPNLPLKKGGIPPYQRGMKGVVIPLFFKEG